MNETRVNTWQQPKNVTIVIEKKLQIEKSIRNSKVTWYLLASSTVNTCFANSARKRPDKKSICIS